MQKLREEFQHYKTRQEHWEQAYSQAKSVSISLSHCCPNLILITHVQLKKKWVGIMYICVYNKQINFRHVKLGREKLRNL